VSASVNGSGGATINGAAGGGASLPTTPASALLDAANAGKIVALTPSTGVGSTFTAQQVVGFGIGDATGATAGNFLVGDGTGGSQLASVGAAAVRSVIGAAAGVTTTTYYAADGTAANGAGGDATASVSGSGSASTLAMGVGATARNLNSSTVACGTWVSPAIPQTAKRVTLYLRSTVATGFTTGGYRYLQASMRRSAESPPASMLFGCSVNDNNSFYSGNNRTGSSSSTYTLGSVTNGSPLNGTDRWMRVTWELDSNGPRMRLATGATTGSTRPTLWAPVNLDTQTQSDSRTNLGTLGTGNAQIILGLESYGTAGVVALTLSLTLEVET
jgi:hypothetical protein